MLKRVVCIVLLNLVSGCLIFAQNGDVARPLATGAVATSSTLQYGYKNLQGECELAGDAVTMYWDSVPCLYLHVMPSVAGTPITGSVVLTGTTPGGTRFISGPYPVYPDRDGGAHLYVVYNDGLGDAGDYAFIMSYLGDDNHQASESIGALAVPIRPLPTTVMIEGPATILAGNTAVFSGKLASPVFPSVNLWGPLALYDGETLLEETYTWSNSFLFTAPLASAGTHTISARFGGLPGKYGVLNAAASSSNSLNVVAFDRNPEMGRSVKLNVTPNPPARDKLVSLVARVANKAQRARGTVTFFDGRTPLSQVPLISSSGGEESTATLNLALSVGTHIITARSDAVTTVTLDDTEAYASATSAPVEVTVSGPAETATQLLVGPDGSRYRVSATVFGYGSLTPVGMVSFRDLTSTTALGSVTTESTQSLPAFTEPSEISFSGQIGDVATADLNGDGFADIVIADATQSTIHVLMGKGEAVFHHQQEYPVSAVATALTITDIDRDGDPEIVVGGSDGSIEILSRTNDTLSAKELLKVSFVPHRVLAGDLNGDGITDLVILGQNETSHLSVAIGNANGSFDESRIYAVPGFGDAFSALLADLNSDGIPDLLISATNSGIHEMLGTGDGTLQAAILVSTMSGAPITADFNCDGNTDLAFVTFEGTLAIQLGRGDGTFEAAQYYYPRSIGLTVSGQEGDTSETTPSVAIADFNADGIPDLITQNAIYLGAGDGTFSDGIPVEDEFRTVSDLNNDGAPDLIKATNNGLQVRYGGTAATVHLTGVAVRGNGTHSIGAEFTPSMSVPYGGSVSGTVQVEATVPAFKFAVFPSSLSFEQGGTAMATVAVVGMNGYSGTLRFGCEQLPRGLSCVFRPSTITLSEAEPYNQTDVVVSVVEEQLASHGKSNSYGKVHLLAALLAGALGLTVMGTRKHRATTSAVVVVTALFFTLSCGDGHGIREATSIPTASSTYNISIVVSDETISHTTQLMVTVQ